MRDKSKPIEFEADARLGGLGKPFEFVIVLNNIDGRHMLIDNALGQRLKFTMTPVEPELKPCPHCGGEAEMVTLPSGYHVRCKECYSSSGKVPSGYTGTRAFTRTLWNRRTSD